MGATFVGVGQCYELWGGSAAICTLIDWIDPDQSKSRTVGTVIGNNLLYTGLSSSGYGLGARCGWITEIPGSFQNVPSHVETISSSCEWSVSTDCDIRVDVAFGDAECLRGNECRSGCVERQGSVVNGLTITDDGHVTGFTGLGASRVFRHEVVVSQCVVAYRHVGDQLFDADVVARSINQEDPIGSATSITVRPCETCE